MLLTAVMTGGSIFAEYAYAAPEDDIDTEIILEEETAAEEETGDVEDGDVNAAGDSNVSVSEDMPVPEDNTSSVGEDVTDPEAIDYNDIESIRYGTYATPVDGVVYLPDDVLKKMSAEELEVYVSYCDELADVKQQYPEIEDMVIFADEKGRLCYSYELPAEVISGISTVGFGGDVLMEPGDDDVFQADDIEFIDEEDIDASGTGNMAIAGCNLEIADIDTDYDISDYEDIDLEAELKEQYGDMIIDGAMFSPDMKDYFCSQLDSTSRKFYDKAYEKIIQKKKRSYSYSDSSRGVSWAPHCNAVSALEDTYPTKFGWKNPAKGISQVTYYNYWTGKASHTISMAKSRHYSGGLNSKANKQIEKLVKEAYSFAAENYPLSPTYGVVYYFNKWIIENNYYDYRGTYSDNATRKSAVYFYCHRQYGILLKGYGVCESYALAMSCLLDKAGIQNVYIVGDAGGGHAWNYVKMPNGSWYMLDSTWNDSAGSWSRYFLVPDDSTHTPRGQYYANLSGLKIFSYPSTAGSTYSRANESFSLPNVAIKKGKSVVIEPKGTYAKMITSDWVSSDPKVVSIGKNGKVKGKKAGSAVLSCKINGLSASCTVVVYNVSKMSFAENGKGKFSATLASGSGAKYAINIEQKDKVYTAQQLYNTGYLEAPVIRYSKKNIVNATYTISGDQIILSVSPLKAGKTVVKVKFAGKTVKLNVKVNMNGGYNSASDVQDYEVNIDDLVTE